MSARRRLIGLGTLAVALVTSALSVPLSRPASAADGTTLRSLVADSGYCSIGTGLAFDGSALLTSCWYDKQIRAISPIDGHRLGTYTIDGLGAGATGVGALAYDRQRAALWAWRLS